MLQRVLQIHIRPRAHIHSQEFCHETVIPPVLAPGPAIMSKPFRFLTAVSATFFRSANENEGNSPVVPSTTTPSAPCDFKYASKSLYSSGSKFRFLSHGVDTATQNSIFSPAGAAESALPRSASSLFFVTVSAVIASPPNAARPATPKAAAAPTDPKNVLRVCLVPSPISPEV